MLTPRPVQATLSKLITYWDQWDAHIKSAFCAELDGKLRCLSSVGPGVNA